MTELVPGVLANTLPDPVATGSALGAADGQSGAVSFQTIIAETALEATVGEGDTSPDQVLQGYIQGLPSGAKIPDEQFRGQFTQALVEQAQIQNGAAEDRGSAEQAVLTAVEPLPGEELPLGGNLLPLSAAIADAVNQPEVTEEPVLAAALPIVPVVKTPQTVTDRTLFQQQLISQGEQGVEAPVVDAQRQVQGVISNLPETSSQALPQNDGAVLAARPLEGLTPQVPNEARPGTVIRMETPLGQPGWGAEVSNRVRWLVQNNISGAEIRLNPPELGPVEIQITADGDETSVLFVAQQAATREALEQAMPRLREALESNGMQLINADVSEHNPRGRQQQNVDEPASFASQATETEEPESDSSVSQSGVIGTSGLIDFYI